MSAFFDVKKQGLKTNLKKSYQCSVSIEIFLDLKVCFFLVTYQNKEFNCTPLDQSGHLNFCDIMITVDYSWTVDLNEKIIGIKIET